ncbi:UTRA domain-containing protein [Mesoplasma melaleucae]|uniref:UTRA domain-containing protein n=1 Tax=Mesoplasma melaleucae TaxID=81459 RepID=UPI000488840C|nr:UTRA domain-containing protein [Mesoplasma melaleucae]
MQIVKPVNGRGYVVQDKIQNNLLFSFRKLFPNSTNEYYDLSQIIVNKKLASVTKYPVGTMIYLFKCIRKDKTSNEVILYQESYVSKNLCKNISLKYLNKNGFMNYIENQTSSKVSHSSKKFILKELKIKNWLKHLTMTY